MATTIKRKKSMTSLSNRQHHNRMLLGALPVVCIAIFGVSAWGLQSWSRSDFAYEVIPGVFIQDDNATIPADAGPIPPSFGLVDSSSKNRWRNIRKYVEDLNKGCKSNMEYKVVFFGRHGEGYHNVAEAFYGTPAWDDYWSKINGNGTITWGPDAKITPKGVAQAENATAAWEQELSAGIPIPEKIYSSPLSRSSETAKITFKWWFSHWRKGLIMENFRETIGVHTCDKRETKTYIKKHYGQFLDIENGFTEQDELWTPDHRETDEEMDVRTRKALNVVFSDTGTWISVTAHGGAISSIFRVIGHRPYSVPTGGVVPVLIKATRR